jgi:hypothetical protein
LDLRSYILSTRLAFAFKPSRGGDRQASFVTQLMSSKSTTTIADYYDESSEAKMRWCRALETSQQPSKLKPLFLMPLLLPASNATHPLSSARTQRMDMSSPIRQVSATNEDFSYSLLNTGPFLYRELSTVPSIINVGARTAEANVTHNRALCSRVLKSPTYCDWPCYAYSSTVATFRLASLAPQPSGT